VRWEGAAAALAGFPGRALALAWLLAGCAEPAPMPSVDLVELFALADATAETERIDFGTPAARPHLTAGWSYDETLASGRPFVWAEGERSVLRLEVGRARDLRLRFRCWPFHYAGAPEQKLGVWIGGEPLAETVLSPHPAWYTAFVPAARLRAGENTLELRYAAHARPRDVLPGARDRRPLAVAWDVLEVEGARRYGLPEVLAAAGAPTLRLPFHAALDYYLAVPDGGELRFDAVVPWSADAAQPTPGHLEVELEAAGAGERQVFRLRPDGGPGRLTLPAQPQGPVRLSLRASLDAEAPAAPAGLDLRRPTLATPLRAGARGAAAGPVAPGGAGAARPNILVYLVDTLRPDHLGAYGYARPTSPHLDAFAAEATLFRNAVAQSSWTRPAVASLFTGLNPQGHGVVRPDRALPADLPLLPELLRGLGYRTHAVITNGNVADAFGFDRGFDGFRYLPEGRPGEMHQLSDRVNRAAFRWLERRSGEAPFFLYLHTSDPHGPYTPREPYRERFAPDVRDPRIGSAALFRDLNRGAPAPPAIGADLIDLYDGEIAFNDASFGALLEKLRELGLEASTLVVFVSDHGEAFAEHGSWQHGNTLYSELIRVPLVVRFPDGSGRGRVVTEVVRQVDLLPTLLDYLGAPLPAGLHGRSLLPLVRGQAQGELPVAAVSHLARARGEWESVLLGERKLIRTRTSGGEQERVRLFDLSRDPEERDSVAAQEPVWRGYLLSQLKRFHPEGAAAAPAAEIDPELRARLEALGYL
jgi:arylsulfatase A-like enzyme